MFVDEVDIHVAAGGGGRGCLAFRREKFVPRGGPSGGDGGHGGSVFVVASPHTNTLINFRFHPEFSAKRGEHGQGSNCTGHGGADAPTPPRAPGAPQARPRYRCAIPRATSVPLAPQTRRITYATSDYLL